MRRRQSRARPPVEVGEWHPFSLLDASYEAVGSTATVRALNEATLYLAMREGDIATPEGLNLDEERERIEALLEGCR